jgi:tripartite-type tricarboxylate transporter receptor subunit TctC
MHKALVEIVALPEFKTAMDANGAEPVSSPTPAAFTDMLKTQVGKYQSLTKSLNIKLD